MKKKILALVLTMSLLLSCFCIGVSAVDAAEEKGISDVQMATENLLSGRGGDVKDGIGYDYKTTDNDVLTIKKSASWTDNTRTKATISIDVTTKLSKSELEFPVDVVFVADISESMAGQRLVKEKEALKAAAKDVLDRNNDSRVALVSFSTGADTRCDFTDSTDIFNSYVDGLSVFGLTDYGAGFNEAKRVIDSRSTVSNAVRVVFISDGLPTSGLPVAQGIKAAIESDGGKVLGLQYMLGMNLRTEFRSVVHEAYAVDSVGQLTSKLCDLLVEYEVSSSSLQDVSVTDVISSHFNVANVSKIVTSTGAVSLSGKTINWNVGSNVRFANLSAEVTFAHEESAEGEYLTNNGNAVVSYTGGSLSVASPELVRRKMTLSYFVEDGLGTAPAGGRYWPGERVIIAEPEDNPEDDTIFRYWKTSYNSILRPGDIYYTGSRDETLEGVFATAPSVVKSATATESMDADWIPLSTDSTSGWADWYYKIKGDDTLCIKYRGTGNANCTETVVNTAKGLFTEAGVAANQITTLELSGTPSGFNYTSDTILPNLQYVDMTGVEFEAANSIFTVGMGYMYIYKPSYRDLDYPANANEGSVYVTANDTVKKVTFPVSDVPYTIVQKWGKFTDKNSYQISVQNHSAEVGMFAGCGALEEIDFGNGKFVTSISNYDSSSNWSSWYSAANAVRGCPKLKKLTFTERNFDTATYGYDINRLTLPPYFAADCPELEEVDGCFYHIGPKAFANCSSLDKFNYDGTTSNFSDIYKIESYAFANTGFTSANIRFGSTPGDYAFSGCQELISVTVTGSSTGSNCFSDCPKLETAYCGGTNVGSYAFYNCPSLTYASCRDVGVSAFYNCTELTTVDLNEYTSSIGNYAFSGCSKLKNISLPSLQFRSLGSGAFYNCSSLESITLPETLVLTTSSSSIFSGCTSLSNVEILTGQTDSNPFPVTSNMFENCTSLEYIQLPPVTTSIGTQAFKNSGLKYIDLTTVRDKIATAAFDGCSSLTTLIAPTSGSSAFSGAAAATFGSGSMPIKAGGAGAIYGNSSIETWCGTTFNYGGLSSEAPAAPHGAGLSIVERASSLSNVEKVSATASTPHSEGMADTDGRVNEGATIDYSLQIRGVRDNEISTAFNHGVLTVRDKLPEGLTLVSDSITVSQYAVVAKDYDPEDAASSFRTAGQVVKQNGNDYSIDSDGAIIVKIAGLESIGLINVGFQCTVDPLPDDVLHRDFYNTATVQEHNVVKSSNVTYHYVDKNTTQSNTKRVTYKYMGTVPASAVVPNAEEHEPGTENISVAEYTAVSGYRFEGWTFYAEDGTVFDEITEATNGGAHGAGTGDTFTMPDENLLAIGTYSSNTIPTPTEVVVSYEFSGDIPTTKIGTEPAPTMINVGQTTTIAANPTSVDGYFFQGWTIDGTAYAAGATTPALTKDTVVRGNWVKLATDDETSGDASGDTPVYYTVTVNYSNAPAGFTSQTFVYVSGEHVTLPEVTNVPATHIFDGYISDDIYVEDGEFTMPEKNVVVTGIFVEASMATPDKYISYYDGTTLLQVSQITSGMTTHTLTEEPITSPVAGVYVEDGLPVKDGYLFAGWYTTDLTLGTTNGTAFEKTFTIANFADDDGNLNLYAAWVPVGEVTKDNKDNNDYGDETLKGFSLEGVQIRSAKIADKYQDGDRNTDQDALRFVTVYRNDMLTQLQSLKGESVTYGYTAYAKTDIADLPELNKKTTGAVHIDCTKVGDENHRMFDDYRLSTLVIKYDGTDVQYKGDLVEARAYVNYTDANGFERRGYHTYPNSDYAGGCRTSFNLAWSAVTQAYDELARVA